MKDFETIKNEAKNEFYKIRYEVGDKAKSALNWVVQNPQAAAIVIPVVYGVGKGTGKVLGSINRKHELKKVEDLKERYMYDRSIGAYLHMNRKPTTNELIEIETRKKYGESLTEILRDMRLI